VKRTRAWLALLLFLHLVVHPLVHAAPLAATASGHTIVSTALAHQQAPTHDCEVCRLGHSFVPIIGFAAPEAGKVSSRVIADPTSDVIAVVTLRISSRAPPAR